MIKIEKALLNEKELIIQIANDTFKPIRPDGFDFRTFHPKVYLNPTCDYSLNHYIAREDDKPVGTFGNLIYKTNINNKDYSFSFLGTVSVLPEYQGKGIMKEMMTSLEKDNLDHHVAFALLTGKRKRYNYYGYEKSAFSYAFSFVSYTIEHMKDTKEVILEEMTSENQNKAYELYKKQDFYHLRDKSNFYLTLKSCEAKGYNLLDKNHNFIGYCSFLESKKEVVEIMMEDLSYLPGVIKTIMISSNLDILNINVSPFQKELISCLSDIAENININTDLHIKIYDTKVFLAFIYELNNKYFSLKDKEVVYNIDNELVLVSICNGAVNVTDTDRKPDYTLTKKELITHLFAPLPDRKEEQLYFDLLECDRF